MDIKSQVNYDTIWFDNEQVVFNKAELNWFVIGISEYFSDDIKIPRAYPTFDAGVRLEWWIGSDDGSVEFDIKNKKAFYSYYNHKSQVSEEADLDLSKPEEWLELNEILLVHFKK